MNTLAAPTVGVEASQSKSQASISRSPTPTDCNAGKVQPEHEGRADPLGALPMARISDVEVATADFFVPVTSQSSDEFDKGPATVSSIGYAHDPGSSLGFATDLGIHRASKFFDHLTATREEYVEKMKTYHLYAALRNPKMSYSSDFNRTLELKTGPRRSMTLDAKESVDEFCISFSI